MKIFKKILILLAVCLMTLIDSKSQELTYMLPDIGTPGLNTYVEFIAPTSIKGFFGRDGLYLNNTSDSVRIELLKTEDESKVVIGPCIVSWDGRMISTQIFVKPDVKPNSHDWELLNDEFKIDLVVKIKYKNNPPRDPNIPLVYRFYLVNPWPAINHTGGGILGDGTLGKRSPRGAMIFKSLELNGTYTISTRDCDPNTFGNQGFLPCVLFAMDKIVGKGNQNAIIDASGTSEDDNAKTGGNGGPGGGGGGGKWSDRITASVGYNGGGGFSGGGKGGTNYPLTSAGVYKNSGEGSYSGSNNVTDPKRGWSLNGVEPPFQNNANWEAAGGGTGHPFGTSGINTDDGNTPSTPPLSVGYGGGSGWSQKKFGGAGSYASRGKAPTTETAGKIHGNQMIVPLAGGSGGASGNPEGVLLDVDVDAGSGGGGGGAIRIFSNYIDNIEVKANGGDGVNGDYNAHGGGGSGGAVDISTKTFMKNSSIKAIGGNQGTEREGGNGYIRYEELYSATSQFNPSNVFFGITTDSTQKVYRDIENSYTGKTPINSNCSIYRRLDNETEWQLMPYTQNELKGAWTLKYTPTGNHKYEYFVLLRNDAGSGKAYGNNSFDSLHLYEQKYLLSQNAANLFILEDAYPDLKAPVSLSQKYICENKYYDFDFAVNNDGLNDLILSLDKSYFKNSNPRFNLISPSGTVTIKSKQQENFKIRYTPDETELINIDETFMLWHNDTLSPTKKVNPFPINLKIDSVIYTKLSCISTTDLGTTMVGKPKQSNIIYRNEGNVALKITNIPMIAPPFEFVNSTPTLPCTLKAGEIITFVIKFDPTAKQVYSSSYNLDYVAEKYSCNDNLITNLTGSGSIGNLEYNNEIDFGFINWCDPDTIEVSFKNSSSNPSDVIRIIDKPYITGDNKDDFKILSDPTKQYPLTMTMQDGIMYKVVINPVGKPAGKYNAVFNIKTDLPGSEDITIPISADINQFDVKTTPPSLNFGNVYVGFDSPKVNLMLINDGVLQEHLKQELYPQELTLTRIAGTDDLTPSGGKIDYQTSLKLMTGGNYSGELTFTFDQPCDDVLLVPILAKGLLSEVTVIDTLDFGTRPPCARNILRDITFENNSEAPYVIIQGSEELLENTDGYFFLHASGLSDIAGINDTIMPTRDISAGQIIFDSREGVSGPIYAKYKVKIYQNGEYKDRIVVLKAIIDPGSYIVNSNPTIFAPTIINQKTKKSIEIINTGNWQMQILSLGNPNVPEFTVLPNSVVGSILNKGDKVSFEVEFWPKTIATFQDFIKFDYLMDSCTYKDSVRLNGVGGRSRSLYLRIPIDLKTTPDKDRYNIPIYAKLKSGDDPISNYKIDTIKIAFKHDVLFYRSISKGIPFNLYEYKDENRVISFSIDKLNLTESEILISELSVSTLLGSTAETDLIFDKVILPNDGEITEINTTNGHIIFEICQEGGDRLLLPTGAKPDIILSPNPADQEVDISIIMIESGNYTLDIYNLTGIKATNQTWIKTSGGKEIKTIKYNLSNLMNGVYFVKLTTPSQTIIKTLNVNH